MMLRALIKYILPWDILTSDAELTDLQQKFTQSLNFLRFRKMFCFCFVDEAITRLKDWFVNHELTDEQLNEKFGEYGWKKLPDQVYSKVAMHPAKYEVIEHHIAVYAAKNEDRIEKAPHPAELLNNSIASASLVAGIMNGKYTNALPLYRIEQEFKRNGIEISRQTMSNWVIRCTERYLSLIYDELHRCLLSNPVIQADETQRAQFLMTAGSQYRLHICGCTEQVSFKRRNLLFFMTIRLQEQLSILSHFLTVSEVILNVTDTVPITRLIMIYRR